MFEKVNPSHPDKVADRIAGAIVDLAYTKEDNPKVAVEVLIGHGEAHIMAESSVIFTDEEIEAIVCRITGKKMLIFFDCVDQDPILSGNQEGLIRCGDNGIFRGKPTTLEQTILRSIAMSIYKRFPTDGKYILDVVQQKLIVCQSNASGEWVRELLSDALTLDKERIIVNPLGDWTGGPDVDAGATNRKLGSDMGNAVTGGGLHGKDLSKADVTLNICAYLKAQETGNPVEMYCAIGDEKVNGVPYHELVERARRFIKMKGGFEKFAEWGLI